jgi:hypothetical protein
MGSVDELALVVVGRAFLLSSVDLGVGGIEVDRRALFDECCATLGWQHREHTRDELHVGLFHMSACRGIEALAQSDHRRRRRHTGHSAQSETGSVLSLVVEVAEEVTTGEHHLGECDHQPAEHEAAFALLDRRSAVIDRVGDPEQFVELGHQMKTGPGSDPTVRRSQHHLAVGVQVIPQPNVQVIHHWAPRFLSTPSDLSVPAGAGR